MTFRFLTSFLLEPISYLLLFGALLLCLVRINQELKYKVLIVTLGLLFFVVTYILFEDSDQNTYLYSLVYLLTGTGWGLYFRFLFFSKVKRVVALVTVTTTATYFLVVNHLLAPPLVFDSSGYVISSSGIILLIFIYYHQLLAHIKAESLSLNFDFWIVSSQLIYHLGAFGIFLTYNHFTTRYISGPYNFENQDLLTYLWGVHNVLLFLTSLLTWVGVLWIVYRRKSTSS